ncbi:MAG: DNA polymerase I [Anaerolineales bacterium]|nr:DNA polymerase I [Anaerolineales bacterium]
MPPVLYLLDGHALAYRTYFALTAGSNTSRWMTSKGEPTAGIYGFASVLLRFLEKEQPDYLAVAFDVGKTFRDDIFPDYKGTREKMPDDLRTQIERIREMVDAFNIPRLEMEGYEADDVLGSVANAVARQGLGVKIITGDRDLLQLVQERIIVSLPGRSLSDSMDYTSREVEELWGIRPDQVVDLKALMGDSSDNIPGVRGVGEKTASSLLNKYDTLDGVYQHVEEQSAGLQRKLTEGKEDAYLSQTLARIITNLNIPMDLEKARITNFNPENVKSLFQDLEFRTLTKKLNEVCDLLGVSHSGSGAQLSMFGISAQVSQPAFSTPVTQDFETIIVDNQSKLDDLVNQLKKVNLIAFDTETTGTDKMEADLVGISLAFGEDKGYYIPVGHKAGNPPQLSLDTVIKALTPAFTNPDIPKAGHNLKYDYVMLLRNGLDVTPLSFDTMIAEWLRDPMSRNLGLKRLSFVELGVEMTEISDLLGTGKKQKTMAQVLVEDAAPYAAADAVMTFRLVPILREKLKEVDAVKLFNEMEMPLIKVLSEMEMTGIRLDTDFLLNMSQDLNKRIQELTGQVYQAVGEEFNLNSTQQLSVALFDTLGIIPPDGAKKTSSGYYSTAAGVLEELQGSHPVIEWILEYRELSKLLSTYVDALPIQVNSRTGRVHTSYNQTGTSTGRIASNNPNLQNIPIRTEVGKKVREAFIADKDNLLLAVDYSQVELRIVAHMANDKAMLEAFQEDQDIHAATAAAIYNITIDQVTPIQRRHAKAINFGLIYGMSPFGLTRTTDLTLAEAEEFVKAYFTQFPGVKSYLDNIRKTVVENEYVETLFGRKRYFHGLSQQKNYNIRQQYEREAINAPVQGTAADIMKQAMLNVDKALKVSGLEVKILLQVHDELVLECSEQDLLTVRDIVQQEMSAAYQLKVPLKTDARAGKNWGTMEKIQG